MKVELSEGVRTVEEVASTGATAAGRKKKRDSNRTIAQKRRPDLAAGGLGAGGV